MVHSRALEHSPQGVLPSRGTPRGGQGPSVHRAAGDGPGQDTGLGAEPAGEQLRELGTVLDKKRLRGMSALSRAP